MTHSQTLDHLRPIVQYFLDFTNLDPLSPGYGLTSDHTANPERASIAASGFMLCAVILGAHYGWIEPDRAQTIVHQSVASLRALEHHGGFLPHFLDRHSGTRFGRSEYSTIDTLLMLMGALASDQYAADPQVSQDVDILLKRIDYQAYTTQYEGKKVFAMSYNDLPGGDYVKEAPGYIYHWHMYAEQLMMYWLYPGADALEFYRNLEHLEGVYQGERVRYSPGNTLFVYHFPLAFLNLKGWVDADGFSPYINAQAATRAHRQLSIDLHPEFKTFNPHAFGFNASDTPQGYRVFHGLPNVRDTYTTDGTVAPFSVVGALPFLGDEIWKSIDYLKSIPGLYGAYGFQDAFNQENGLWISDKIISIDKGLELLSFDAAHEGIIQNLIAQHPQILAGFKRLKYSYRGEPNGNH
jgi:hypothetical protein